MKLASDINGKIAIIGLGYVGLPLAVEFGKNRETVGFDINDARIAELNAGIDNTLEVAPDELSLASKLSLTADLEKIRNCSIYIVTVPTPIDEANRPNLTPLRRASETVAEKGRCGYL